MPARAPLGLFWDIARLRASPADLPASVVLLGLVLVLNLLLSVFYLQMIAEGEPYARLLFSIAFGLLLCWSVLRLWQREARFLQTAIAIYGTDALLTIVMLPIAVLLKQALAQDPATASTQFLFLIWLSVLVWSLVILGHILRSALELPLLGGVSLALALFVVQFSVSEWLFGIPAVQGAS